MDAPWRRAAVALAVATLLAGCSPGPDASPTSPGAADAPSSPDSPAASETPSDDGVEQPAEEPSDEPAEDSSEEPAEQPAEEPPAPISMAALAEADLTGGDLGLGAVRERTAAYTSYDVTFASTTAGNGTAPLRISGVLNVPTGRGPFPAVVPAHGYIAPAVYARGRGMTRERGFLAQRGYVALH